MTSLASREEEIPFDDVPGRWAEVGERVDRHEQLRLVRGDGAPALVVMTEDDFDQAVQDAADLALCRELLSRMEPLDREQAEAEHAEFVAFLEGI
jgi:PHD/YefM family antitoxin component YafN of YafNO toxin-antitoxin module